MAIDQAAARRIDAVLRRLTGLNIACAYRK
jgi:hypothetical protein